MRIAPGQPVGTEERRSARRTLVVTILIAVAGATALLIKPPVPGGIYAPCPWHYLTGTWCPGCGSLRGLHRLLHGDVAGFARYNAFAAAALPFLLWSFVGVACRALAGYRLPQLVLGRMWILGLGMLIIVWGVVRNLVPGLAPGAG